MFKNRYTEGYFRLIKELTPVSKLYNCSKISLVVDALWCYLKYGATPNEYLAWEFYKVSKRERKQFFTARDSEKYYPLFNDKSLAHIFNNKEETNTYFSKYISRKWLYTPNASDQEINNFIKNNNKIIVKPNNLYQGKGVHIYNGESIEQLKSQKCLLEEFIIQHPLIASFNTSSVNTIRVYTLSCKDDKNLHNTPDNPNKLNAETNNRSDRELHLSINQSFPYIERIADTIFLSSAIRIGGKNAVIDNYHSGGVAYPIDIQSGIICGPGTDIKGNKYIFHPASQMQITGVTIPNWSELKKFICNLDSEIKDARMIAWDIAILENGFELLEANFGGNSGMMQAPRKIGLKQIILNNL